MADRAQIVNLGRDDEERQFLGRAWDWAQRALRSGQPHITHFLHPGQITLLTLAANACGSLSILTDGGYPGAERVKAAMVPEDCDWFTGDMEIAILHITVNPFAGALSHRDYLGALLGLGITRDVLGDILVTPDKRGLCHHRQGHVFVYFAKPHADRAGAGDGGVCRQVCPG